MLALLASTLVVLPRANASSVKDPVDVGDICVLSAVLRASAHPKDIPIDREQNTGARLRKGTRLTVLRVAKRIVRVDVEGETYYVLRPRFERKCELAERANDDANPGEIDPHSITGGGDEADETPAAPLEEDISEERAAAEPKPDSPPVPVPDRPPVPDSTPEPVPASTPEPEPASTPEPVPDSTPEPVPDSTPEPEPTLAPALRPTTSIAIQSIHVSENIPSEMRCMLSSAVAEALIRSGRFARVGDRVLQDPINGDGRDGISNCDAEITLTAALGNPAEADLVVSGSVVRLDDYFLIALKMRSTQSNVVQSRAAQEYSGGPLGLIDVTGDVTEDLIAAAPSGLYGGVDVTRDAGSGATYRTVGLAGLGGGAVALLIAGVIAAVRGGVGYALDQDIAAFANRRIRGTAQRQILVGRQAELGQMDLAALTAGGIAVVLGAVGAIFYLGLDPGPQTATVALASKDESGPSLTAVVMGADVYPCGCCLLTRCTKYTSNDSAWLPHTGPPSPDSPSLATAVADREGATL